MLPLLAVLLSALLSGLSCQAAQPNVTYRWIYRNPLSILAAYSGNDDQGMGSYFGTRNSPDNFPELTPQLALEYSHGATFAVLPNGSLATVWQASIQWWEGSIGQSAFWSLSDDDGDTWGPPMELYSNKSDGGGPIWGPQIHVSGNTLFMFFSGTAPAACESSAGQDGGTMWPPGGSLMFMTSTDNGNTWSNPKTIFAADADGGIAKLNVARVTVTEEGNWLLPFWREASGPASGACWGQAGQRFHGVPGVFMSSDQGESWNEVVHVIKAAVKAPRSKWLIENAISAYTDKRTGTKGLLQVFRDNTGTVWQSTSLNGGRNWTDAMPGTLPSPDSRADISPLPGGGIIVAFNNVTDTLRQNLSLATTADGGASWQHLVLLEGNTSYAPFTGAFSYPTVLYMPTTNRLLVAYSVGYPKVGYPALLAGAPAVAPGIYDPSDELRPQRALPPGVRLRKRRSNSPAPGPSRHIAHRGAQNGFRRRLGEAEGEVGDALRATTHSHARGLRQIPFQHGAWGYISYGIRLAFLDADQAIAQSQSSSQSPPPVSTATG